MMSETCIRVPRHAKRVFYIVSREGLVSWDEHREGERGGGGGASIRKMMKKLKKSKFQLFQVLFIFSS